MSYKGIMNSLGSSKGFGGPASNPSAISYNPGGTFEAFLQSLGLDAKTMDPQDLAALYAQWVNANPNIISKGVPTRSGFFYPGQGGGRSFSSSGVRGV